MPTLVLLLHLCAAEVSLFTFAFQAPSAAYDVMQVMAPIHIVVKGLNSADFFFYCIPGAKHGWEDLRNRCSMCRNTIRLSLLLSTVK